MTGLAAARALRIIGLHPAVHAIEIGEAAPKGEVSAILRIETRLWAAWRAAGESPSGVRAVEPVTLTFPSEYPTLAPQIALRQDFRRDHPHLMPGAADKPPVPCILDGRVSELVELRGIEGLVDQIVEWLERAAMGTLIDPAQGWEPARRDGVDDILIIDGDGMRALADARGGAQLSRTVFSAFDIEGKRYHCIDHRALVPTSVRDTHIEWKQAAEGRREGVGAGIIAWAKDRAPDEPFIVDTYAPETVATLGDLRARAGDYGCRGQFDALLNQIAFRLHSTAVFQPTPLAVTFLVRRPYTVIGTTSPIELRAYIVDIRTRDDLIKEDRPVVRPCALRDQLSQPILRRASGQDEARSGSSWSLLGCGSVGSKIALHMARRGGGPACVVDSGFMSPHNFARHALLPDVADQRIFTNKATALSEVLATFKQPATPLEMNALILCATPEGRAKLRTEGLLNTTASAVLRERLAFLAWEDRPALWEAYLLGAGKIAYAAFEGAGGNPNISDLAVESYRLIAQSRSLSDTVFSAEAEAIAVGQGCSTVTFPMPDDRLSALTAGLGAVVAAWRSADRVQSPDGEIRIGYLGEDGLSQTWTRTAVDPWVILSREESGGTAVRLSARVDGTIRAEIAARPGVETGGILLGRFAPAANVFQVVDVLPAPPDSTFNADKFVLGTEGLRTAIGHAVRASHGSIYALGTWHNHLGDFGPSMLDVTTALGLALQQFFPVLMLIAKPQGYTYVTAETFEQDMVQPRTRSTE